MAWTFACFSVQVGAGSHDWFLLIALAKWCIFWTGGLIYLCNQGMSKAWGCMTSGRLREVKIKRNLQTVISKRGRGRLREVVAYKRFQRFWFDWNYFGILKTWSLKRGGCKGRFHCMSIALFPTMWCDGAPSLPTSGYSPKWVHLHHTSETLRGVHASKINFAPLCQCSSWARMVFEPFSGLTQRHWVDFYHFGPKVWNQVWISQKRVWVFRGQVIKRIPGN